MNRQLVYVAALDNVIIGSVKLLEVWSIYFNFDEYQEQFVRHLV